MNTPLYLSNFSVTRWTCLFKEVIHSTSKRTFACDKTPGRRDADASIRREARVPFAGFGDLLRDPSGVHEALRGEVTVESILSQLRDISPCMRALAKLA